MSQEPDDIERFEELLSGRSGFEDHELARLSALARALEAGAPAPAQAPAGFRTALRERLLHAPEAVVIPLSVAARVRATVAAKNDRMRRSGRRMVAMGLAAAMMLVGGSALAAARGAVPGDALYGVDRLEERVLLGLTFGAEAKADRQLDYARERVAEMHELARRGVSRAGPYVIALESMDALVRNASRILIGQYRKTNDLTTLDSLIGFAQAQRAALESLAPDLPPAARPAARSSIDLLIVLQNRVSSVLRGCPCPADILTPPATTGGAPGGVACTCPAKPSVPRTATPPRTEAPPKAAPPKATPPKVTDPVTRLLPDVGGTNLDDTVEEIVKPFLETLGISPSPDSSSSLLPVPSLGL